MINEKSILSKMALWPLCVAMSLTSIADDDNGLRLIDIARDTSTGIDYRRTASYRDVLMNPFKKGIFTVMDVPLTPAQAKGSPGVAVFDFDMDGDKDIYVTNGPGTNNSLYSNQLMETGELEFVDVGASVGVSATDQDSQGVCYGDIDNDGDKDLYVLGSAEPNRLFENNGDGTFTDITVASNAGGQKQTSVTCSMGDVNNDGLLDIAVANTFNFENRLPLMVLQFSALADDNLLFVNQGNNQFVDRSDASGLTSFKGVSWSIALVDYDADGDADIFVAEDQGTRLPAIAGGKNFGVLRVFNNDGTGVFTDKTQEAGLDQFGAWMSLSFGDLDGDGNVDIFASNIGDYFAEFVGPLIPGLPFKNNLWSSKWYLSNGDGTFYEPGLGALKATPFGWGSSISDYDNDGDHDIVFYGGVDMSMFFDATNPGAFLNNDGEGNFNRDTEILSESGTDHILRDVQGLALGDLNQDGLLDVVSVSSSNWPKEFPLSPFVKPEDLLGSQFDDTALIWGSRTQVDPNDRLAGFTWNGFEPKPGTLAVEVSNGESANNFATLRLVGGAGTISGGKVNADGVGAIVKFTPKGGKTVAKPIVSGASFSSADDIELVLGLGSANRGTVEVLWPGGIVNHLYRVKAGQNVVMPEIPCVLEAGFEERRRYISCVMNSLKEWTKKGVITRKEKRHLLWSALVQLWNKR